MPVRKQQYLRLACIAVGVLLAIRFVAYRHIDVDNLQEVVLRRAAAHTHGASGQGRDDVSSSTVAETNMQIAKLEKVLSAVQAEKTQLLRAQQKDLPPAKEIAVDTTTATVANAIASNSRPSAASPPPPPVPSKPAKDRGGMSGQLTAGQSVMAPWLGLNGPGRTPDHYYKATILGLSTMEAQVHYLDFGGGERFDSWVPSNTIRRLAEGQELFGREVDAASSAAATIVEDSLNSRSASAQRGRAFR